VLRKVNAFFLRRATDNCWNRKLDSLGSPVINVAHRPISWTNWTARWFQVPPVSMASWQLDRCVCRPVHRTWWFFGLGLVRRCTCLCGSDVIIIIIYTCKKLQFKTAFNGDTAYLTQLKQQKSKRWYSALAAHRHNVNLLLSNSTFLIFAVSVVLSQILRIHPETFIRDNVVTPFCCRTPLEAQPLPSQFRAVVDFPG